MPQTFKVAVLGAGAMGSGIAQVAAAAGHAVCLYDLQSDAVDRALLSVASSLDKLVAKNKITAEEAGNIKARLKPAYSLDELANAQLIIEAVVEKLAVKQELFSKLELLVSPETILASNTSSLSVTAIAGACKNPGRVLGLHFFNPATLMPLVEVIPAVQTKMELPARCYQLMKDWGKVPVLAKDTPGFIVNRVARPFYGESLRICEEGIADQVSIDSSLRTLGGFRMGPFELMDLIGNDINYTVTETVWTQTYFDARYKPSLIQKKMVESGRLGRKTGQGYYDYSNGQSAPSLEVEKAKAEQILERVLCMLINEAADALHFGVASAADIDLAVTRGVNYPKGLLAWCDEVGAAKVLSVLDALYDTYREDRYRASSLLRKMAKTNQRFFS